MRFINDGFTALYSANSTSNAYTLTPGISTTLSSFTRKVQGAMGVWLGFYGVGSDNNTGTYRVNGITSIYPLGLGKGNPTAYLRWHMGAGAWTLASGVVGDGTVVPATNYWADTATFTQATIATSPVGMGSTIEAAYSLGTATAFSPADNATIAWVLIPLMGFVDFIEVESIRSSATSQNVAMILAGRN